MRVLELASTFEKLAQNTVPFNGTGLGRDMTDQELARAIRLDLEAELDAINLYSNHLQATKNKRAIETLEHVIKEEKEHLKLFCDLLRELDPEQAKILDAKEEHEDE